MSSLQTRRLRGQRGVRGRRIDIHFFGGQVSLVAAWLPVHLWRHTDEERGPTSPFAPQTERQTDLL